MLAGRNGGVLTPHEQEAKSVQYVRNRYYKNVRNTTRSCAHEINVLKYVYVCVCMCIHAHACLLLTVLEILTQYMYVCSNSI